MKLYMVSLGPGDYELITIKALKALKNCDAICVPTKSKGSFDKSITYKIITKLMSEFSFNKEIIPMYTPMKFLDEDWQKQVNIIVDAFKTHKTLAFVTLGDCSVYSTVYYLLEKLEVQYKDIYENCEVIAGVTSFSQASAKVKKALCKGDEAFKISPLLGKVVPCTTVYMRPKIGMNTSSIMQKGDMYTFENLNLENENISSYKKEKVQKYMTLFIDFI